MTTSPLRHSDYRPTFSGHETFPLRYGWLQKAYTSVAESTSPADTIRIFRDPASIARFGVGRNMVSSMRYWAMNTEIIGESESGGIESTWLGELLFGSEGVDQFLEEIGSLWLLHWHLASRDKLTSLYWLFNEFTGGAFARKEVVRALLLLAKDMGWPRVSQTTVDRDVQCLLRAYVGGRGGNEAGDSVLSELGLARPLGGGKYSLVRGQQSTLPDAVFLFAVWDFWCTHAPNRSTLSYEALAFSGRSPGRVFLLDDVSLVDRLEAIEEVSNRAFSWSETAGLKQLVRQRDVPFEEMVELLGSSLAADQRSAAA